MEKRFLLLALIIASFILISGCIQNKDTIKVLDKADIKESSPEKIQGYGLGNLCLGDQECTNYCAENSLECEDYCKENPSNNMCQERFSFVYTDNRQYSNEDKKVENNGCKGEGTVTFTYPPRKIEDIEIIQPMGLMIGGHVTPIDHQYYYPTNWKDELKEENLKEVYSPGDGIVTNIQSMPEYFNRAKGTNLGDYRLVIYHTCTFYTIYIHINELSPKVQEAFNKKTNVEIKAGELIGRANSFDFSAHNEEITLNGFLVPESYQGEPWKIHTVDPFDYFSPEIKTQLLTKNMRGAEPLGGKIDYDIDGRLIGSWFEENTNGYRGIKQPDYWGTHVSFSPDALDPNHFIISLGNYKGEAKQFGAKGNAPNPKDVDVSSGLIKYELVDFDYKDGSGDYWDRINYAKGLQAENKEYVHGVVLVEIIDTRKLKLEVFADRKASEVSGFTGNAKIYER